MLSIGRLFSVFSMISLVKTPLFIFWFLAFSNLIRYSTKLVIDAKNYKKT